MMRYSVVYAVAAVVALAGCSGENGSARQILGLDRKAPDAFAVTTHAPLAVPSNLNSQLPPPQPGAQRPQEESVQAQARSAVLAAPSAPAAAAPSAAEQALLQQAGPADSNVRTEVNREAAKDAAAQKGPLDWMLFWRDKPQPGVAVDAKAEADRLAKARAAGQAATSGATPVIEESGRLNVPEEIK